MSKPKSKPAPLPVYSQTAASDTFAYAFVTGGGCVCECVCGRVHYDWVNFYDWEDGELEGLKEKSAAHPDDYIGHDYTVETSDLDGRFYVVGCPCNGLYQYERFILNYSSRISKFLSARAKEIEREAEAAALAAQLAGEIVTAEGFKYAVDQAIREHSEKAA